jgi:hypothetical protein
MQNCDGQARLLLLAFESLIKRGGLGIGLADIVVPEI